MRELTFIGPLSGPSIGMGRLDSAEPKKLLLIAEDGTEFQLKLDQRLASVVAREFDGSTGSNKATTSGGLSGTIDLTSPAGHTTDPSLRPSVAGAQPISPREVQDRVRAGDTAQEIVADTGAELAYVQRFASQVEAECEQVIAAAAACEVTHEGRRQTFSDATAGRLRILGVKPQDVTWHALKADHEWSVVLSYDTAKESAEAWFEYSLAHRTIIPTNEEAEWLLAQPHHQEQANQDQTVAPPVTTRATIQNPAPTTAKQAPVRLTNPTNNAQLTQSVAPTPVPNNVSTATQSERTRATSSVEDSDQWDAQHPAAKALKRREAAANEAHVAGSNQTARQVNVSTQPEPELVIEDRDSRMTQASLDETAQTSPEWENLLFGSPSNDS